VALSLEEWNAMCFVRVDKPEFPTQAAVYVGFTGSARAVRLVHQVFSNQDGSTGVLHLVCSGITCECDTCTTNCKNGGK
jgi:hypothetical protein